MTSPHDQLKETLKNIRYPAGIMNCPGEYCAIRGQSFFPGGKGHLRASLPVGGIMYLGHNFDKIDGFKNSVLRGYEENLTWRVIRAAVFPKLAEENIWFTNYFMGVLTRTTNIGPLDMTSGFVDYEEDCWNFFNLQVQLQQPRLIVALGKEVVRTLSGPNRLDIPSWGLNKNDPFGPLRSIRHKVELHFKGKAIKTEIVAAYHPSYGRDAAKLAAIAGDSAFINSYLTDL